MAGLYSQGSNKGGEVFGGDADTDLITDSLSGGKLVWEDFSEVLELFEDDSVGGDDVLSRVSLASSVATC